MRTYKFKAWNGTKMLLSENAEFYLIPNNKVQVPSQTGHEFYDKDYPIMQFTGLLDKNGVEIFEGDVIHSDTHNENFIINFNDGCFSYESMDKSSYNYLYELTRSNLEVIGNIHIHEK